MKLHKFIQHNDMICHAQEWESVLALFVSYIPFTRSHWVDEWLVILTLDHEASGVNPTGDGIQLMTVWYLIAQGLLLSAFHRFDVT